MQTFYQLISNPLISCNASSWLGIQSFLFLLEAQYETYHGHWLCMQGLSPTLLFIVAMGISCLSMVCFTNFAPYFDKNRALAVGLMAAGSGLGSVICTKLIRFLFDTCTFTGALVLYGKKCLFPRTSPPIFAIEKHLVTKDVYYLACH